MWNLKRVEFIGTAEECFPGAGEMGRGWSKGTNFQLEDNKF